MAQKTMLAASTKEDDAELQKTDPSELTYTISYRVAGGRPRLDVCLTFEGNASGQTRIKLPSEWAGQRRFYETIKIVPPRTSE